MSPLGHLLWCCLCTSSKEKSFNFRMVACSRVSKRKKHDRFGAGGGQKLWENVLPQRKAIFLLSLPSLCQDLSAAEVVWPTATGRRQSIAKSCAPYTAPCRTSQSCCHMPNYDSACGTDGQAKKSDWPWASSYLGPQWPVCAKGLTHCETVVHLNKKPSRTNSKAPPCWLICIFIWPRSRSWPRGRRGAACMGLCPLVRASAGPSLGSVKTAPAVSTAAPFQRPPEGSGDC